MSEANDQKDDLPDIFGAMTVKELRQGLRRGSFVVSFVLIQILAVLAMVAEFDMGSVEGFSSKTGILNPSLFFTSGPFWMVAGLICVLVMPLGGLILMKEEMEEGNYELLLMTPLTRWRVVRGKWFALWGLCLITFISLLPYMIVRYFIGGIDAGRNLVMVFSVIAASGMMGAGAIGASAFRSLPAKLAVMALFLGSLLVSGSIVLLSSAFRSNGCGVIYHINALSFWMTYTLFGLALARSRIRLTLHHYEIKPSSSLFGLLVMTPVVVGMSTAMTVGYGGFVGMLGMAVLAWLTDMTPKPPAWANSGPLTSGGLVQENPIKVNPIVLGSAARDGVELGKISEEGGRRQ